MTSTQTTHIFIPVSKENTTKGLQSSSPQSLLIAVVIAVMTTILCIIVIIVLILKIKRGQTLQPQLNDSCKEDKRDESFSITHNETLNTFSSELNNDPGNRSDNVGDYEITLLPFAQSIDGGKIQQSGMAYTSLTVKDHRTYMELIEPTCTNASGNRSDNIGGEYEEVDGGKRQQQGMAYTSLTASEHPVYLELIEPANAEVNRSDNIGGEYEDITQPSCDHSVDGGKRQQSRTAYTSQAAKEHRAYMELVEIRAHPTSSTKVDTLGDLYEMPDCENFEITSTCRPNESTSHPAKVNSEDEYAYTSLQAETVSTERASEFYKYDETI